MDDLIKIFNKIHELNKELKSDALQLPQIVVIGSQSSGKSSVLESIVGCDFLPKGIGTVTRCPLRLQMINDTPTGGNFSATFRHSSTVFRTFEDISNEIANETKRKIEGNLVISEEEIVLEIVGHNFPTLTFVDLPGFLKVSTPDQPPDLEKRIEDLARKYVSSENSIILAISPANVDIATSEAIKMARIFDTDGKRTFHVLTKLDIMDEGTDARSVLTDPMRMRSQGIIGVINRNQQGIQSGFSITEQRQKEKNFFGEHYSDLCHTQGTDFLVKTLVSTLKSTLKKFLPKFRYEIKARTDTIMKELMDLDPADKLSIIFDYISIFYECLTRIINGSLDRYGTEIVGGAKLSVQLYKTFYTEMGSVKLDSISDEIIQSTIINTGGTKDINFSFDKPFALIIRNQIRKFEQPSDETLTIIKELLIEFVEEALCASKIGIYPSLFNEVREVSYEIIEYKWERTRQLIMNYVECETYDITFTNPYSDLLRDLRNIPMIPEDTPHIQNKVINRGVICAMVSKFGLNQPIPMYFPFLYMGILMSGLTTQIMDAYHTSRKDPLKYVMDVLDSGIGLEGIKIEIYNYIEQNTRDFMDGFRKLLSGESMEEHKISLQDNHMLIIKHLLELYFDMVRRNVINYVPKAIQTFLIKDISEEMRRSSEKTVMKNTNLEEYLYDDSRLYRVKALQHDLKRLEAMRERLGDKADW